MRYRKPRIWFFRQFFVDNLGLLTESGVACSAGIQTAFRKWAVLKCSGGCSHKISKTGETGETRESGETRETGETGELRKLGNWENWGSWGNWKTENSGHSG